MKYVDGGGVARAQIEIMKSHAQFITTLGRLEIVKAASDFDNPAGAEPNLSVVQHRAVFDDELNGPFGQAISDFGQTRFLLIVTLKKNRLHLFW